VAKSCQQSEKGKASGYCLLAASALLCMSSAGAWNADLASLSSVPLRMVQAPLAQVIGQAEQSKRQPYAFAVGTPLVADLNDGLWEPLGTGDWRWRLRVSSPGAKSLNFEFARFHLPPDAELRIYDLDGAFIQGPYTAADHTPEGRLWTAVINGDQAVLDLRVPYALRDEVELELAQVNHGFRGFIEADISGLPAAKALLGCSLDAICPEGNGAREAIRAVAKITINGQRACTGNLINNQRQDGDPLFITANHCGIGTAGLPASSVVAYWIFESPVCRILGTIPDISLPVSLGISQSGSSLLANDTQSDFALLRLNRIPSTLANVYYAGWIARQETPQQGFTVHHPGGLAKSISLFTTPAERRNKVMLGDAVVDTWEVHWSAGVTAPGSSGAGLFNKDQHLVGWLSGGSSSCEAPREPDYFGRMEVAWDTYSDPSHQLKAWLDPDNTGTRSQCGRDNGAAPCTKTEETVPPADGQDGGGGGGGALGGLMLPLAFLAIYRRRLISRRASRA
jgi:hypothetical protein